MVALSDDTIETLKKGGMSDSDITRIQSTPESGPVANELAAGGRLSAPNVSDSLGVSPDLYNPLGPRQVAAAGPLAPKGGRVSSVTLGIPSVDVAKPPLMMTPPLVKGVDWENEGEDLRSRVSDLMHLMPPEMLQAGGFSVESGFRTHEQQKALWDQHVATGYPAVVAQPGASLHEQGKALDWHFDDTVAGRAAKQWFYANAPGAGLAFPFPDDDGHMQLAERVTTGPSTASGMSAHSGFNVPSNIAPYLNYWANYYGLNPNVFASMIQHESGFDPKQVTGSHVGLGQLGEEEANAMGVRDRTDINQGLMGAAKYLRQMLDSKRANGDYKTALGMYRWGPSGDLSNTQYADAVMGGYQKGVGLPYAGGPAQVTPTSLSADASAGQVVAPPSGLSQPPGMLGSPGLLALAMGLASRRISAANISYDPWSVQQAVARGTDPRSPGTFQTLGRLTPLNYETRVGRNVPGPVAYDVGKIGV